MRALTYDEYDRFSEAGGLVPVYREIPGDLLTPVSAFLALEASEGVYFGAGYGGDYESPAAIAATHGYDPERPAMQASLLLLGPGVAPGPIAGARLIDIAPTMAHWLGLPMPDVEGRPLATPTSMPR